MTNIETQKHFEHAVFKGENQLSLSRFEQISLVRSLCTTSDYVKILN